MVPKSDCRLLPFLYALFIFSHLAIMPLLLPKVDGARILFSAAVDSGTHIGSMVPLIKRLASSGHQVVVLELATLAKARQFDHPNISVRFIPVPVDKGIATALAASMFREALNGRTLNLPYEYGNQKFGEFMLTHTKMFVDLLNQQPPFDLVILDELFGVHSFAFALNLHKYQGVPYIVYSTTMMIQSTAYTLALGRNFVAEPNLLTSPPANSLDIYRPRSLLDRLDNLHTIFWDILRVQYQTEWFLDGPQSALPLFGIPHFSFGQMFSHSSFVFADYLDKVPAPLAEGADVLPISANCPSDGGQLPADLDQFLSDPSSDGTILVALGSNVHWRFAPNSTVNAFFGALNRLASFRIVFAFNGILPDSIPIGNHLRVVQWAPQYAILRHPRTKVFISHAGLKSFKETLCAMVPTVYMPIYAEQSYNTKLALRLGFATAVNKLTITERELDAAIQMVLWNYDRFKRNAQRANAFFLDRPVGGLEMAEFGVKKAIEEGKVPAKRKWRMELRRRKGMDLNWAQILNADLAMAFVVLPILILMMAS